MIPLLLEPNQFNWFLQEVSLEDVPFPAAVFQIATLFQGFSCEIFKGCVKFSIGKKKHLAELKFQTLV